MQFTEEEILASISKARETIDIRSKGLRGYDRGFNDCFALVSEYDQNLRGDSSKAAGLSLRFTSAIDFLRQIRELGYKSLNEMSEDFGYETLKEYTRPQTGDILYEIGAEGGTTAVAGDYYWISANGRGSNIYRRIRTIEINSLLLARPIKRIT